MIDKNKLTAEERLLGAIFGYENLRPVYKMTEEELTKYQDDTRRFIENIKNKMKKN